MVGFTCGDGKPDSDIDAAAAAEDEDEDADAPPPPIALSCRPMVDAPVRLRALHGRSCLAHQAEVRRAKVERRRCFEGSSYSLQIELDPVVACRGRQARKLVGSTRHCAGVAQ